MPRHPNKHIQAAIEYAVARDWRVQKAAGHAHIWGFIMCPLEARTGCRYNIHSTPRVPEHHADRIRRYVDACPHSHVGGNN
jgi:hypothetical protein